jgi:hypothetical protein
MRRGVPGLLFAALAVTGAGAAGLGVAAIAGCSASSSSAEEDDGADAAAPPDGGEAAPSEGDARLDATDAGDARDAGDAADARPPPAEAGTGFCVTRMPVPRFCDDFDDGDLTNDWTQTAFVPGSTATLDGTSFTSGPASFHVTTPATNALAANNALLRLTMFAAVTHPKLSFRTFLPAATFTKGAIAIARLDVSLSHVFTLYLRDMDATAPAASLEEYVSGTTTRHLLTKVPAINAWTQVVLDVDLTNGKANVSFDAQKALDDESVTALAGSEATLRIGAIIDGPADAFDVRFDDVVLDY